MIWFTPAELNAAAFQVFAVMSTSFVLRRRPPRRAPRPNPAPVAVRQPHEAHQLAEPQAGAERTRLEVERKVTEAFLTLTEARERGRVAATSVEAADEAFRLVRKQYEAGAVTVSHLVETEVAPAGARSRAIAARFDRRRAAAELRRSMEVVNE